MEKLNKNVSLQFNNLLLMKIARLFIVGILLVLPFIAYSQNVNTNVVVDYDNPRMYTVGGVSISGLKYTEDYKILGLIGLNKGDQIMIPGEDISSIQKRISAQKRFATVAIQIDSIVPKDTVYLTFNITERPRVSKFSFAGVKNSERDDLEEKLNLRKGRELSEYFEETTKSIINEYYHEKGYLNSEVVIERKQDSLIKNAVQVTFNVNKGTKVKIKEITYSGIGDISVYKLDKSMKKTKAKKWYNIFNSKKFNEEEYENDKQNLIDVFHELGYRDARIVKDSIYYIDPANMGIHFTIDKGKQYYFRNITWTGNSLYTGENLNSVLLINKGDIYDVVTMDKRLYGGGKQNEISIAQLYRDQGYLFFNVVPVELKVEGDSVDVEMRMVEGKPATFNNIIINGNNITNEKVVRRAVFTRPGYLYRQTDFERSVREIASMGHFNQEKAASEEGWSLIPNPMNNTVDISYNVEEQPNSQLELSGGWGADMFVGTVGVSFNNFSTSNFRNKEAWRPVPLGDSQQLVFRFQTNGKYYTALTASFLEPWLYGKKPTSLSVSAYYTKQTNSYMSYYYNILNSDEYMEVYGASVGIGTRLKWPDNYFVLYNSLGWQSYRLKDWNYNFLFNTGVSHNLSWTFNLARNNTDQQVYPRQGIDMNLSLQITPPYSAFRGDDVDYKSMSDEDRYRWIEYHKWSGKIAVFTKLVGDLVLMTRAQFGYLGYYNRDLGYSPFEGFLVGGDGMSGYSTYGSEVISLRGYDNYSLTPVVDGAYAGNVYDKFTLELRYPVVLQPSSTIYALVFLEGGNCWADIRDFNPFEIKRSAGIGLRVMLPVVGLLGVDWGYGFDSTDDSKSQFHFVIGQQF